MARGGISGLAVAVGSAGAFLVYAGIRNVPLLDGLRELARGQLPPARPAKRTDVDFTGKSVPNANMVRPVAGPIGDGFGAPRPGRTHKGVDIAAPTGTPIGAAAAGTVSGRGWDVGAGNYVHVRHDSRLLTKYFHLSEFTAQLGDQVTAGQMIGKVGSTGNSSGPHVHFEVWLDGKAVDPASYIGG